VKKILKGLILSNGVGEDELACTVAQALIKQNPAQIELKLSALPLLGPGKSYLKKNIPVVYQSKNMPSGGFLNGRPLALLIDILNGLLWQVLKQVWFLRKQLNELDFVISVGDFTGVMYFRLARLGLAQQPSHFHVNTALSAHLRPFYDLEKKFFEKYCDWVFVRDEYSKDQLKTYFQHVSFEGSTMLDDPNLIPSGHNALPQAPEKKHILLVPSLRRDAFRNIELLNEFAQELPGEKFILALHPRLEKDNQKNNPGHKIRSLSKNITVSTAILGDLVPYARIALGMTGTGCEQLTALGVPLFLVETYHPASNKIRLEHYQLLLGKSCEGLFLPFENQVTALKDALRNEIKLNEMRLKGPIRFGKKGAADRIAFKIWDWLV
jgi:uncharacterized protein (TIGR03492 family)